MQDQQLCLIKTDRGLGRWELLPVLFVQLLHLFSLCDCSSFIVAFNLCSLLRLVALLGAAHLKYVRTVDEAIFAYRHLLLVGTASALWLAPPPGRVTEYLQAGLIAVIASLVFREKSVSDRRDQSEHLVTRQRRRTWGEDERILELIEQGYFLYRQAGVTTLGGFSLVFTNRKARDLALEVDCSGEDIVDYFGKTDETTRTLRDYLNDMYKEDVPVGNVTKILCSIVPQKEPASTRKDSSASSVVPFKFYKATMWKLSRTDVLLTLSEQQAHETLTLVHGLQSAIVRTLSHELRTLANGITGNVELISEGLSGEQRVHHNIALCSSYLLGSRLNDFFDYIQLQNGGFRPHYSEFSVDDLFTNIRRICAGYANEKQLSFSVRKKTALPAAVVGDRERIEQILLNLVSKSIEFTEYGQIVLSAQKKADRQIVFKITSFGSSMQKKLEEQMRHLSPTTKKRRKELLEDSSPSSSVENFEALSLEISQIICHEIGSRIVAKNVDGKFSQLRFAVTDGFPGGHRLPSRGELALRRCSSSFTKEIAREESKYYENHDAIFQGGEDITRSAMERDTDRLPELNRRDRRSLFQLKRDCVVRARKTEAMIDEIPSELGGGSPINLPQTKGKSLISGLAVSRTFATLATHELQLCGEEPASACINSKQIESRTVTRQPSFRNFRLRRITQTEAMTCSKHIYKSRNMDDVEKCSVLIVDDDAINRLVLKSLLKKHGYNSIEARDGREAVSLVDCYIRTDKLYELVLVFMDLQMPVLNGIAATERIRELCQAASVVPPAIIGVTADPLERDRELFLKAGLSELMYKPLDTRKVVGCVQKYVQAFRKF